MLDTKDEDDEQHEDKVFAKRLSFFQGINFCVPCKRIYIVYNKITPVKEYMLLDLIWLSFS